MNKERKKIIEGRLIENRIVVWDLDDSRYLYSSGYYGKPIGVPKPKGIQFDVPLVLDLIEGYYLFEKKFLHITNKENKKLDLEDVKEICRLEYIEFDLKYIVYQNLRERGYIVSPGIKFGCDFAVYEKGPGIDHAPYLVQVHNKTDSVTSTSVVLAGRLATSVKKHFILAIPGADKVNYLALDWWRA